MKKYTLQYIKLWNVYIKPTDFQLLAVVESLPTFKYSPVNTFVKKFGIKYNVINKRENYYKN